MIGLCTYKKQPAKYHDLPAKYRDLPAKYHDLRLTYERLGSIYLFLASPSKTMRAPACFPDPLLRSALSGTILGSSRLLHLPKFLSTPAGFDVFFIGSACTVALSYLSFGREGMYAVTKSGVYSRYSYSGGPRVRGCAGRAGVAFGWVEDPLTSNAVLLSVHQPGC